MDYTTVTGVSYIIIHHIEIADADSLLQMISRHSKLPVKLAANELMVEKNHIYLLPTDRVVTIENYKFKAASERSLDTIKFSIDIFFRSLASCCGRKAIGMLLSGIGQMVFQA